MIVTCALAKSKHIFRKFVRIIVDIRKYVRYNAIRTDVLNIDPTHQHDYTGEHMNKDYDRMIRLNKNRRTRQLSRNIILTIATLLTIFALSFGLFSIHAKADSKDFLYIYKYYKSVTVTHNDTLWNYARLYSPDDDYERYIREVIRMNNLCDESIDVSMNLIIPYYSDTFVY